jgi:hypothetical protein
MCHRKCTNSHNDNKDPTDKDNYQNEANNHHHHHICPVSAATGFLRTYAHLIHRPSDFHIAQDHHLIPSDVSYTAFSLFIACFRNLPDSLVSSRYEYGRLRLTRLNWAVRILQPKAASGAWNYHEMYWHTGQYLKSFARPLMFIFGSVAIMLNAMQVVVSIPDPEAMMDERGWTAFRHVSWGSSVVVTVFILSIWCAFLVGIVCLLLAQLAFSVRQLRSPTYKRHSGPSKLDMV